MLAEYLALVRADLTLAIRGVQAVVADLPYATAGPEDGQLPEMRRIAARVKRAALAYRPGARCLPQAAAVARLLRVRGYPVTLVVAVRRFPFAAHAWVEYDGQVLTDRQEVRREFIPILTNAPHSHSAGVQA